MHWGAAEKKCCRAERLPDRGRFCNNQSTAAVTLPSGPITRGKASCVNQVNMFAKALNIAQLQFQPLTTTHSECMTQKVKSSGSHEKHVAYHVHNHPQEGGQYSQYYKDKLTTMTC